MCDLVNKLINDFTHNPYTTESPYYGAMQKYWSDSLANPLPLAKVLGPKAGIGTLKWEAQQRVWPSASHQRLGW